MKMQPKFPQSGGGEVIVSDNGSDDPIHDVSRMMKCFRCGEPVDEADRFCRRCGASLARTSKGMFWPRTVSPQDAARYWENFFRPFFRMAFIFFGCFFTVALILVAVWYFMFHE